MGKNVRHRKSGQKGTDEKQDGTVKEETAQKQDVKKTGVKTEDRPPPQPQAESRCWILYKLLLFVIFILPIIVASIGMLLVTPPFNPIKIRVPPPPEWTGPLEPNEILTSAEHLFRGQLFGPESIVYHQGHIYTGTADGLVLDIVDDKVKVLTTFGNREPPCKPQGDYESEPRCGRPLGMRMDNDGHLIVIDTYYGIFKVNVTTGEYLQLLSPSVEINGVKPTFLNDLDIASDGTIYFTESSVRWQRRQFMMPLLDGRGDGRLVQYDVATKTTKVLMDGLFFANGVQLSPNEDFVLVVELGKYRIHKYNLQGPKKGTNEPFVSNLPGIADNIRPSHTGGYWMPLITQCRQDEDFSLYGFLGSKPQLRKQIAKLPIPFIQMMLSLPKMPKCVVVVELDQEGRIVRSLQDTEHKVISSVSQVEDDNGVLYLASFHAPFIGKVDIREK